NSTQSRSARARPRSASSSQTATSSVSGCCCASRAYSSAWTCQADSAAMRSGADILPHDLSVGSRHACWLGAARRVGAGAPRRLTRSVGQAEIRIGFPEVVGQLERAELLHGRVDVGLGLLHRFSGVSEAWFRLSCIVIIASQ